MTNFDIYKLASSRYSRRALAAAKESLTSITRVATITFTSGQEAFRMMGTVHRFMACAIVLSLSALNNPNVAAADDRIPADSKDEQARLSAAPTDITSDSMDFDLENRQAIFLGNVRVVDGELELKADKLIVQFDEENKVENIDADGNVTINSGDNKAVGGQAFYKYDDGIITLSKNPELIQGDNRLVGADEIIYTKDENKFKTKGGPVRIILYDNDESEGPFDSFNQKEKDTD